MDATILYAVLAISARHRELTMGIGNHKSHIYESRCLEVLIPSLNDQTIALSDGLLASAMLLRLLEEMTEPVHSQAIAVHAVSAPVILRIKQGNIEASSFSHAAIVVALRQEIFVANMTMRPIVEAILDYCNVAASSEPTSEAVWTYRMIVHAARVTNYTYMKGPKDVAEWDRLLQYLHEWNIRKPASFEPMNHVFDDDFHIQIDKDQQGPRTPKSVHPAFPAVYYSHDCPTAAQQYLQLCRILLLAHDPRAPSLGLGRASFVQAQENKIRDSVRIICGVAQSNPEFMPARLTAGLAIAMCGELFDNPVETTQLLEIVTEAEMHLGWPCLKVRDRLKSFWHLQ